MKRQSRKKFVGTYIALGSGVCAGLSLLILEDRSASELLMRLPWICLIFVLYLKYSVSSTKLNKNAQALVDVYRATTEALASAIAAKDTYEQHHVSRVQSICLLIAEQMGFDLSALDGIRIASLVHDVGKLGVPEYILLKPGPLNPEEFAKISNHAIVGAKILEHIDYPWNIAEVVRHHHERYDGTGYPDHLVGDKIPLASRIIAVAEVYDALVSDRCYRKGWPHAQAIEHIEKLAGSHFDPTVVSALMEAEPEIALLSQTDSLAGKELYSASPFGECCAAPDSIAHANREFISLFEIAESLSSTLELDEVLALLASRTKRMMDAVTCAVFLVDDADPEKLVVKAAAGRCSKIMKGATTQLGKGITGTAALQLTPYMGKYEHDDIDVDTHGQPSLEWKSCMVVPIVSCGKILGTINVYDIYARAFSNDDLSTLSSVANRASLAIHNASAFENVRDSAMKDPVTGLYNTRYLHHYLEHEFSRAARHGEPISVLGLDLDNFKAVNDTFGHFMGDIVLRDAAVIFQKQLRDYDLVVRNGGDEFVIVLPGTPPNDAAHTADRIRKEIDKYAKQTIGKNCAPLGVSVGVASYPGDAISSESLLESADAAMYRDKRARKQQIAA